jgi:hypothetical protein
MVRPKRIPERLVALFLLGVVLMFPPLLGIFNQQLRTFGLPLLYLYLFVTLAVLIMLTAAVVRSIGAYDDGAIDADLREAPRAEDRADA